MAFVGLNSKYVWVLIVLFTTITGFGISNLFIYKLPAWPFFILLVQLWAYIAWYSFGFSQLLLAYQKQWKYYRGEIVQATITMTETYIQFLEANRKSFSDVKELDLLIQKMQHAVQTFRKEEGL